MPVTQFRETRREPCANGQPFGEYGPFEQIDGTATFAVDPDNAANALIVDLDKCPRDAGGRVTFEADFSIVQPVTPNPNSRLLIELPNRGRRRVVSIFNRGPAEDPTRTPHPGDGFLFRHGFTVASIGWQHDVYRSDALMGLEPPVALENGSPIRGQTIVEIRPNQLEHTHLLANRIHKPYPAADLDDPDARLTVRDYEDDERTLIPRSKWQFARETPDGIIPDPEHIYYAAGFQPGKYYYVTYTTEGAPVAGAGLLAFRDIALFLRDRDAPTNPSTGGFRAVHGFGVSQTGRMIREFLHLGLNAGENGSPAYDGLLPHVAGARRGSFNHRFAQPSDQATPGFGHDFPFADDALTDPATERSDGLLARQRTLGHVPKIVYTNSSAEYWRGDCALMHVDTTASRDLPPAPESRIYHFAGTQHGAGGFPQATVSASDGSMAAHPFNVVDYTPLLRAALVNLDRWVTEGIEPPPNNHPRIDNATAAPRDRVLDNFDRLPGVTTPERDRLWVVCPVDLGPRQSEGIARWPAVEAAPYPCLVSAVASDGNELAGIRLPDVAVPVATHAGWNTRAPESGAPEQQIPMQGFSIFFPATQTPNDPRQAISDRYPTRCAYIEKAREAAQHLVEDGYALEEDLELMVNNAVERYDHALAATAAASTGGRRGS